MLQPKKEHPKEKSELHPRNKHRERYDFGLLINTCPELASYVKLNLFGDESIDFHNPIAVKLLNKALLKHYYDIDYWDVPSGYLCPPIPSRANYIHYIAELLGNYFNNIIPTGNKIKCLDIGVGANCVYPIIGNKEYGWSFVGTDIDKVSVASANKIIELNPVLRDKVEIRFQTDPNNIFKGIINKEEYFDLSICNPPFHVSPMEAQESTLRKLSNLKQKKIRKPALNFGGTNNELWCEGDELRFVIDMINESRQIASNCFWFSTLISKEANLINLYKELKRGEALEVKTIPMGQGNKISRIVAWTFLTKGQQKEWIETRWK